MSLDQSQGELEQAIERYLKEKKITKKQKTEFERIIRHCNVQYEDSKDIIIDNKQRAPGVNIMPKEQAIEELNNFQIGQYKRIKGELDQVVDRRGEEDEFVEKLIETIKERVGAQF